MHRRKLLIGAAAVIVAAAAWYLFRPELLFVNAKVWEALPKEVSGADADSRPVPLAVGNFHTVNHASKGVATIYRRPDGRRLLRFTDFETSNGPALHVYLVAVQDAHDSKTVREADTIDLGELKGNVGDQNYDLPADVDLANYRAVSIWCKRFSVNFATAPLAPTS